MKKLNQIFPILFILLSTGLFAQDISPQNIPTKKNEISGGLSYTELGGSSATFEYRHYFKRKIALTLGTQSNESTENKFHIGFESYSKLSDSFSFYFGLRVYYAKRGLSGINFRDITGRNVEYGMPLAIKYDINNDFVVRLEGELLNDRLNLFRDSRSSAMHLKFGYKF